MARYGSLIWQALLVSCILRFTQSAITIQKENEEEICADFVCTRHSLKTETRTFVEDVKSDDARQIECKSCAQCTDSGYSVCLKAKNTDDKCLCAQEIPRGCNVSPKIPSKPIPEQQQMDICYTSSLRHPPQPTATNEPNNDLIVTIEQFWLRNYWKNMKLQNLTLYYEFPIQSPHLCDGLITTVRNKHAGEGTGYLCTPMLKIELEEEPIESEENTDGSISHDDYDNNLPPEIQFERAVFDSAPYVRFYYRIQVKNERQLNAQGGVVEQLTTLTSDVLTYNLDSTIKLPVSQIAVYKTSTARVSTSTTSKPTQSIATTTTSPIKKVNIEQRQQKMPIKEEKKKEDVKENKSQSKLDNEKKMDNTKKGSFLDEHLNNGGQLQLIGCGLIVTLSICLLLIVGTFLYRRHIGSDKRSDTKTITKQMNGYEYRATVQDEKS